MGYSLGWNNPLTNLWSKLPTGHPSICQIFIQKDGTSAPSKQSASSCSSYRITSMNEHLRITIGSLREKNLDQITFSRNRGWQSTSDKKTFPRFFMNPDQNDKIQCFLLIKLWLFAAQKKGVLRLMENTKRCSTSSNSSISGRRHCWWFRNPANSPVWY